MVKFSLPTFEAGGSKSLGILHEQEPAPPSTLPTESTSGTSISEHSETYKEKGKDRLSVYSIDSSHSSQFSDDDSAIAPFPRLRKKWRSSLLNREEPYEKPWLEEKDPKKMWENMIFAFGCLCGGALGVYLCVHAYLRVTNSEYCMIMDDKFETIDTSVWNYEYELGGFNEGSFEWTTNDTSNIYVDKSGLHIVPTLTTETTSITDTLLENGYTLNLTESGICTSSKSTDCVVTSNSTLGSVINPVRSARINTKGTKQIKYGRVEVVAKMPKGDWIWPSIRMLPVTETYGAWPASGEIDIAMLRGNGMSQVKDGLDTTTSTLHWGPSVDRDQSSKTIGGHMIKREDYSDGYHTFGLEWGKNYLYTYLDGRPLQVLFVSFPKSSNMWKKGGFASLSRLYSDPWSYTGRPNTPFDQPFYLILDVAVGGTNGWFVTGEGKKPWDNSDTEASAAFWGDKDTWYKTWGKGASRGMTVKSVKMWELGKCGSN